MELEADFLVRFVQKAAGWLVWKHQQVYGMDGCTMYYSRYVPTSIVLDCVDGSCTTHAVYCDFLSE